jgi:CrcB protein
MREILLLAIAGAIGTLSRYALSGWAYRLFGEGFAYGTLLVNVAGCLLLGFIMHLSLSTDIVSPEWRLAVTVGFLGAFTTFSTFGYETLRYVEDGSWRLALGNVGANLLLGLGATWIGFGASRALFGGSG